MFRFMRRTPMRQNNSAYKYAVSNADLYAEKSTFSPVLAIIPRGSIILVLDGEEDWYKASYNNQTGYLSTDSLSLSKYTWKEAPLRPFADAQSNPIGKIPAKTEVQVISMTDDWSYVLYNNKKGYIFTTFLTDDGNPPNAYDFTYFYSDMTRFVNDNEIKSPTINLITTDLENKLTYVFEKGNNSLWQLLYQWNCTVGKPSTPTIRGTFYVDGRKPYFGSDSYRVKYATRIKGSYYYHSILFNAQGTEITDDRLGLALSHGCIRLAVPNAQWIYDNILDSTAIVIN